MNNIEYISPTHIYLENEGVKHIGERLKEHHLQRVYFVYGGSSLKRNGHYQTIIDSLNRNGIVYEEYGGIAPNPDIEDVRKMKEAIKQFHPDCILAAGGGSVLDAGKLLAHAYYYEGDPLDFNKHLVKPTKALPIVTIITLAASGSESSDSCVISSREEGFKQGFNSPTNFPLFSIIDPSLIQTVPLYQIGIGLADMFSHSFERYLSPSSSLEPCDDLALGILSSIVKVSKEIIKNPDSLDARRALLICGSIAHNGVTSYGKAKNMPVHASEHLLSARYPELAHGQGIALLLIEQIRINGEKVKDKLLRFGEVVFGLSHPSLKEVEEAFNAWIDMLPIYHTFEELPFVIRKEDKEDALNILKERSKF